MENFKQRNKYIIIQVQEVNIRIGLPQDFEENVKT
jgi:hypothetical protein